jgi:hypothetical protein
VGGPANIGRSEFETLHFLDSRSREALEQIEYAWLHMAAARQELIQQLLLLLLLQPSPSCEMYDSV